MQITTCEEEEEQNKQEDDLFQQIAEELGKYGPRGVQRLLGEADWDEEAVRNDLQAYVIEHQGEEHGIW
jgi:hypothetical protein